MSEYSIETEVTFKHSYEGDETFHVTNMKVKESPDGLLTVQSHGFTLSREQEQKLLEILQSRQDRLGVEITLERYVFERCLDWSSVLITLSDGTTKHIEKTQDITLAQNFTDEEFRLTGSVKGDKFTWRGKLEDDFRSIISIEIK